MRELQSLEAAHPELVTPESPTQRVGAPALTRREPIKGRIDVRGEVYLPTASFEATNKERVERGEPAFANPRNAAAGAVRQLDPKATAKRNLAMWAYSASGLDVSSQSELLEKLDRLGLRVNPDRRIAKTLDEVIQFIAEC